ncbi:hypothetical protein [Nitrosomonas communis]|uniref:hypothetical protein n=1 Tax=Nitrosomonas communis TaxID=44574 RepID=UPI0011E85ACF|nr:hypothetical protein [Nitrosomonas communis]
MRHYSALNRKRIATIFSVIIFGITGTNHAAGTEQLRKTLGQRDAIGSAAGSTSEQGNSQRRSSGTFDSTPDSSTGTVEDSYGGPTGDKSSGS